MTTESPILPSFNKPGKRISIVLAVAVHLLLAGFLFYGVRWQTKATDVVEVELVRATPDPAGIAPAASCSISRGQPLTTTRCCAPRRMRSPSSRIRW